MRQLPASTLVPALLAIISLSAPASAMGNQAFLTGTVVDPMGMPVPNVNIDVLGIDGNDDPTVVNGGTAMDGTFNVLVDPEGTYEVRFFAPPPPVSTLLNLSLPSVLITGTTNLGTVVLEAGVAMSGTVLDPGGSPLGGVNLDILYAATGVELLITGDTTNGSGVFTLAVPTQLIDVLMDTTPVGTSIAPHSFQAESQVDFDLGNIQLEPGFLVTAIVRDASSSPIQNADYDVYESLTDRKLYTPGDNTNSSGFVDFVVPAGTYNFDVCPPPGVLVVADQQRDIAIGSNHTFGVVVLQPGVLLSGTTFSHLGVATPFVDVDVNIASSGVGIPLCADNSDASGAFGVVVPAGATYEVIFDPPYAVPLGLDVHNPVVINSNTVLNSNLPPQEFYSSTGSGTPGTGGVVPSLTTVGGTPRLGNSNYTLYVSGARGGSKVIVNIGLGSCPALQGWQSNYSTSRVRAIVLLMPGAPGSAGTGFGEIPIPVPTNANFVGLSIFSSARVIDPQAVGGLAYTPELCTAIAP